MTTITDRSPQKQLAKSAIFTTATCASLIPILNFKEILFSPIVIFPLAMTATSSQNFTKTRMVTSGISGLFISDQLLPSSKNPYINIAKTATLVGLIYLALSPASNQGRRVENNENPIPVDQYRRKRQCPSFIKSTPDQQNTHNREEPKTPPHNPSIVDRRLTTNPALQNRHERVGVR